MKKPDDIEAKIILRNNEPLDDFLGLSPADIHILLYDPFGDKSSIKFRDYIEEEIIDQIPLFRIAEDFLKIIRRDNHIKLTPLGALPKKVLIELYDKRYLLDRHIESGITKLWKEDDCVAIKSARLTAELTGLVKKISGKITLTKKAIKLLENNKRFQLFKLFFQAFTEKFNWSLNDRFPEQPIGQLGWAFSITMLDKFGDQPQTVDFYANKYLKAFPKFITFFKSEYSTPKQQFIRCYGVRTFERFLLWFGFVTVEKQKTNINTNMEKFIPNDLLKSIFEIND